MVVYVLEKRGTPDDADEIYAVVSSEDVAKMFYGNDPANRRWRSKWLDDANVLHEINVEPTVRHASEKVM